MEQLTEAQIKTKIRAANQKLLNGDSLSDAELLMLQYQYGELVKGLELVGVEFNLATNELRRRKRMVDDFIHARGHDL